MKFAHAENQIQRHRWSANEEEARKGRNRFGRRCHKHGFAHGISFEWVVISVNQNSNTVTTPEYKSTGDGEEDSSAPPQKFQDHFCGINFDDWLTLAMKYAFALVRNREYEEADEVLRHLTTAAVFRQNSERKQSLIFALASCALQVNEPGRCAAEIRKIIWANAHLDTQTVRIMSALFSQGEIGAMGYADVNLQKYMLRCIKTIDGAARNAGHASPALDGSSKQQSKGKERERRTNTDEMGDVDVMEDEESIASKDATLDPTKPNPYFLLFYATVLLCNKSYQSSIGEFHRYRQDERC